MICFFQHLVRISLVRILVYTGSRSFLGIPLGFTWVLPFFRPFGGRLRLFEHLNEIIDELVGFRGIEAVVLFRPPVRTPQSAQSAVLEALAERHFGCPNMRGTSFCRPLLGRTIPGPKLWWRCPVASWRLWRSCVFKTGPMHDRSIISYQLSYMYNLSIHPSIHLSKHIHTVKPIMLMGRAIC